MAVYVAHLIAVTEKLRRAPPKFIRSIFIFKAFIHEMQWLLRSSFKEFVTSCQRIFFFYKKKKCIYIYEAMILGKSGSYFSLKLPTFSCESKKRTQQMMCLCLHFWVVHAVTWSIKGRKMTVSWFAGNTAGKQLSCSLFLCSCASFLVCFLHVTYFLCKEQMYAWVCPAVYNESWRHAFKSVGPWT